MARCELSAWPRREAPGRPGEFAPPGQAAGSTEARARIGSARVEVATRASIP